MLAGRLDRRITIRGQTISQSDSGEEVIVWSDLGTVWARKIENNGAERFADRQLVGTGLVTFQMRWSSVTKQLTSEHQIHFDGRDYDVLDVREIDRRDGIEVDCSVPSEEPLAP